MSSRGVFVGVVAALLVLAGGAVHAEQNKQTQDVAAPSAQDSTPPPAPPEVVIKVDDIPIDVNEFAAAVAQAARNKYYHGRMIDEKRMAGLRSEAIDQLVLERLLVREAERRGIEPDTEQVEQKLADLDAQYREDPEWTKQRNKVLPELRKEFEDQSRRQLLEQSIRDIGQPSDEELKRFYADNPSLFTEPTQDHVALILRKVDPSSAKETWQDAKSKAQEIHDALVAGADFAEQAKQNSEDQSAENGGDMGYLHRGMLGGQAQAVIDRLQPGELSEPMEVLEGYVQFKLIDRKPAQLRSFDDVREQVAKLYRRKAAEDAWTSFQDGLKANVPIWVSPKISQAANQSR